MKKAYINIFSIITTWIVSCIHLQATPIDSTFKKSAVEFGKFVSKTLDNKTQKKIYYFNDSNIEPDGQFFYKEYINGSNNNVEIFDKNNSNYINAVGELEYFNNNYDRDNFVFFVFHGRYFLGEHQYIDNNGNFEMFGVGAGKDTDNFSAESNRLKALQAAFNRENMGSVVNTDLEKLKVSVKQEVERIRNNKRIFIFFITEIYEVDYRKEKSLDTQNLPHQKAELFRNTISFYEPIGLQTSEKNILSEGFGILKSQEGSRYDLDQYLYNSTITYTSALWLSKVREQILTTCTSSEAFNLLKKVSHQSYELFTLDERIHLLVLIANSQAGDGREQLALNLLKTTPKDDIEEFLQRLEHQKGTSSCNILLPNVLISCLMYRIDDEHLWIGDNNYTELMTILTDLIQKSEDFEDRMYNLFENEEFIAKNVIWGLSAQGVGATQMFNFKFDEKNALVSYNMNEITDAQETEIPGYYLSDGAYIPASTAITYEWRDISLNYPLRPFDLVLFTNGGKLDIIDEALEAKTMEVVPAVFLEYAKQKTNLTTYKDNAITGVCITLDLLTLWKGIPAFTAAKGLRRVWLGFELLNATGNIVLNINENALGEDLRDVVTYSNLIITGLGVKDLTKATKSFSKIYQNVKRDFNDLNKITVKYFLASYRKRASRIAELVQSGNSEAQAIQKLHTILEKDLNRTPQGKKLLAEALSLLSNNPNVNLQSPLIDFLRKLPILHYVGVNQIRDVTFNKQDNVIDVVVHYINGLGYQLWVDDKPVIVDEMTLASKIIQNIPQGFKKIRLLSCSDIESAQKISAALPDYFELYATNDIVRLHSDGGVTTIAKSGNATQKWRKLKAGKDVDKAPTPEEPKGDAVRKFVQLGDYWTKQQKARYQSLLLDPNRQADILAGKNHKFANQADQDEFDNLEKLGDPFKNGKESDNFYLDGLDPTIQKIYINLRDEHQRFVIACGGACNPYKKARQKLEFDIKEMSKEGHIIDLLYYSKTNATTYTSNLNNLKGAFPVIESIASSKSANPYIFTVNGDNTRVYLGEIGLTHILGRHHPKYFLGGEKNKVNQTNFDANMSINDIVQKLDDCVNHLQSNFSVDDIDKLNKLLTEQTQQINFVVNLNGQDYTVGMRKSIKGTIEIRQFFPGK